MPKKITCPECSKLFTNATGLGSHRSRVHGVAGTSKGAIAYRAAQNGAVDVQEVFQETAQITAPIMQPDQVQELHDAARKLSSAALTISFLMLDNTKLHQLLAPSLSHTRAAIDQVKQVHADVLSNLVRIPGGDQ